MGRQTPLWITLHPVCLLHHKGIPAQDFRLRLVQALAVCAALHTRIGKLNMIVLPATDSADVITARRLVEGKEAASRARKPLEYIGYLSAKYGDAERRLVASYYAISPRAKALPGSSSRTRASSAAASAGRPAPYNWSCSSGGASLTLAIACSNNPRSPRAARCSR